MAEVRAAFVVVVEVRCKCLHKLTHGLYRLLTVVFIA